MMIMTTMMENRFQVSTVNGTEKRAKKKILFLLHLLV